MTTSSWWQGGMSINKIKGEEECNGATHVKIPDGVKTVDVRAFKECASLVRVDLNERADLSTVVNSCKRFKN